MIVADIGQRAASAAERKCRRLAEDTGVEPLVQTAFHRSGESGAGAVIVRPGAAPE